LIFPQGTISQRLTRDLSLWLGLMWLLMSIGVTYYVQEEIEEAYDESLRTSALRLLELATHEVDEMPSYFSAIPEMSALGDASAVSSEHLLLPSLTYQIVAMSGRVILRSKDAPDAPMMGNDAKNGFSYTPTWRVFTLRHASAPLRIHVADSRAHRREELVSIWIWTLLPLLAVFPGIAWGIRRVTKHSLAPVESLVSEIAQRGVTNMSPVGGKGLPPEMQMICDSTNHLLTRLKGALDIERSLAANAAHELRTPLAAARLRLANALDQSLPETARMAMDEAAASLERLARRAEKLLQMSRAESSASFVRDTVDLGALACDVAEDFWRDPEISKRLEVQISRDEPITTIGDGDALALALRNLIENALRYAPGASVKVKVMEPATIIVRDLGPGVDAATLDVITTRHVRRSNNHGGYGLGLSIVNTVVERHNGKMRLYSPAPGHSKGFAVALVFKSASDGPSSSLVEHDTEQGHDV